MQQGVTRSQQARLLQGQVFGIVAGQRNRDNFAVLFITCFGIQPGFDVLAIRATQWIEHAAFGKRTVDRHAPGIALGPFAAHGTARIAQARRERSQRLGQKSFEPESEVFRQTGRRTRRAYRHQHRLAVQDTGRGEVAKFGAVGHIDQQTAPLEPECDRLGLSLVVQGDEGEMRVMRLRFAARNAARPFDQPHLGLAHDAFADHDDALSANAVKKGQGTDPRHSPASHSGTRSASMIAPASMRSATTANLSPSTRTSATKPREL